MKRIVLLLLVVFLISSCSRTVDDTNQNCTSNCTTIRGKISSKDNKPVSNINISLSYRKNTGTYSYNTRKIKNVRTDENGNYEISFHLNDDELGPRTNGYFTIDIDKNTFNNKYYLVPNNPLFSINTQIYSIQKRDTSITKDFYMPNRSSVNIHLKGFAPIKPEDAFQVKLLYPYGWRMDVRNDYLGGFFSTGISGGIGEYSANSKDYTAVIDAAANDTCVIRIGKIKNGISLPTEVRIFLRDNSSPEYTFNY